LIRRSKPLDRIVFIGTKTEPTKEKDQGKLLGFAEFVRSPINTRDVVDPATWSAHDFDERGRFRWPYALPIQRAWSFIDKPLLTKVLERQLPRQADTRAILLSERDQAAVRALRKEQIDVPIVDIVRRHRDLADVLARPTRGPKPSAYSSSISRDIKASSTYAFRFGKRNLWKIGHAQDVRHRLGEVNAHVPHEVLQEQWHFFLRESWPDDVTAYEMEQRVLLLLSEHRTTGERVQCTEVELQLAWAKALIDDPIRKQKSSTSSRLDQAPQRAQRQKADRL